jgi:hypothetical protein
MRPFVVNWKEVALHFIRGVQADAIADGSPESSALPRVSRAWAISPVRT